MSKKWTIFFGVVGLTIGLLHPNNTATGVAPEVAIAFAVPWIVFFAIIGFVIDYLIRRHKNKDNDSSG